MRRILFVLPAGLAVALATTALAATTAAGSTIRVGGTVPLTFTGQYVTAGTAYDVTATGYVVTAKVSLYHVPSVSKPASGPAGQPDDPCLVSDANVVFGQCTVVGANYGELVGLVFDGYPPVLLGTVAIGAAPTFVAPATGYLFLAANDLNLTYYDNSGQFNVTITQQ